MDQGESGGAGILIFAFIWFCSCLVELFGGEAPCPRKGGRARYQGHVVTLFLYIDLYFVLLFLSFPLPVCVCDTRGSRRY